MNLNRYTLVDNEDYEWLSQWKWHLTKNTHFPFTEYAKRNRPRAEKPDADILMHRMILRKHGIKIGGKLVDHINHNGLDNRKENIRMATRSENKAYGKIYRNNTSGYKGVSWDKEQNKWAVSISINGKDKKIGRFLNKEEAALVYNDVAKQYFGEFAYLNQIGGELILI